MYFEKRRSIGRVGLLVYLIFTFYYWWEWNKITSYI